MPETMETLKPPPSSVEDLTEMLAAIKTEQDDFQKQGLDDQIKDLEALMKAVLKAEEKYTEARREELIAARHTLKERASHVRKGLETNRLCGPAKDQIRKAVRGEAQKVVAARKALWALKGYVPWGTDEDDWLEYRKGEVELAAIALAKAEANHASVSAKLAVLIDLAGQIEKEQSGLDKMLAEVMKHVGTGQPATAYWLLTGYSVCSGKDADAEVTDDDCGCGGTSDASGPLVGVIAELLPCTLFLEGRLDAAIGLIPHDQLAAKLAAAWSAAKQSAAAVVTAKAHLTRKTEDLKIAEKTLADLEAGFFRNITNTIASWDQTSVNPAP